MTDAHEKPDWAQGSRDKMNAARIEAGLKPKRRILPWLLLAAAGFGCVGLVFSNPSPEAAVTSVTPVEVVKHVRLAETMVIEPVDLRETVKVTGILVPASQAEVAAQVSGRVLEVLVRPGDTVERGDTLVELDREALVITLNQQRSLAEATRAELISAEQQLRRTEEMAAKKIAAPVTLEQAQSTADALRANLLALDEAVKAAELSLANAALRAPISGIVASRTVEVGQSVAAGTSLLTIVNLDALEFQASGTARTSTLVRAGQKVTLDVVGIEGQSFAGTVTHVNPVATPGTRMIPIYIAVENAGHTLRGGMFASGLVTVEEKDNAIALPPGAVMHDTDGSYALWLEAGTVMRRSVVPGERWNGGRSVEVSGLSVGDVILTTPLTQLNAGDRFTLVEE